MAATTQTNIDPNDSLRQKQLQYNPVDTQSQFNQSQFNPTDMGMFDPRNEAAAGGVFDLRGAGATGSGGRRLDFNIDPQSVMEEAMNAWRAQLPQLNIDFADQSDQLAKRTSALGRTGSSLFNRDTGYISDRSRAAREGLLGNLSFGAATTDAGNDLQAQITRQNLLNSQEGRMSQASIANAQMKNQMAMAQAQNAMQAMLQNQSLGVQNNQFNSLQGMLNDQFNVGNQINQQQFGANYDFGQQQFQNQLGQQAQQDLYNQMMMFGQYGFGGDPTAAWQGAGQGLMGGAGMYGNQAGQANQGLMGGAGALWDMLFGMGNGPGGGGGPGAVASQPAGNGQFGIGQDAWNQFMNPGGGVGGYAF